MLSVSGKPENDPRPASVPDHHRTSHWALWLLSALAGHLGMAQSPRIDSVGVIDASGIVRILPAHNPLMLPAQQNYLTFFCSAPRPLPVQYRLLGLDEGWTTAATTDHIHYANLSGGEYEFQVRASGQPPALLVVRLDVPFWRRVWFLPMVIVYIIGVIGVLIYLFVRYRFLQKVRYLSIRDRIARDLHDDMGSYLSSISILSQTPTTDPVRARHIMERIHHAARHVMESMSDIVWSINPAQDSMQQVIDRMRLVADELYGESETNVTFEIGPGVERVNLPLEGRRDFFLIYKEALTNAARYAQATTVSVELHCHRGQLHLRVIDNGRGFDPAHPGHRAGGGNGLHNLHQRADSLGGTLQLISAPGAGTQVWLALPV